MSVSTQVILIAIIMLVISMVTGSAVLPWCAFAFLGGATYAMFAIAIAMEWRRQKVTRR